jgi:hypothetical protein
MSRSSAVRRFRMKGYGSVFRMRFAATALFALISPGFAADRDQFYIPATAPAPIVLRFAAIDPARGAIDEHWLLEELVAGLQARSNFQVSTIGNSTQELSGLRIHLAQDQSHIVFEYVHVARSKFGDEWGETLTIPVSYWIQKSAVLFLVRLEPSRVAELLKRRTPGFSFLPAPKLQSIPELLDDFAAIMGSTESLELRHDFLLLGQLDTATPPQLCIDKLDYALGRYAYARDEERSFDPKLDNIFLFRTAQESVPLKVTAVDNRGGSRVFYEARLPFELRADGTVKGYDLADAVQAEVNRVLQGAPTREARGATGDSQDDVIIRERR